jgi:transcriptional regulator GlxA family with amidase domain
MQIAIALYPGFTALDAIGPYQVFSVAPGTSVVLCAATPGRLSDDNGLLQLDVEHGLTDVPRPDVLVVPGGPGSAVAAAEDGPLVDWVRSAHEHTTFTTSVCTGAQVLGAAGLLRGLTATTHWCYADRLADYGATATEQRVVFEDEARVVTAAGVSSGIDMALAVLGRLAGDEMAQAVQLGIEYDPQPPYDAGSPTKAPGPIRDLVAAAITSSTPTSA